MKHLGYFGILISTFIASLGAQTPSKLMALSPNQRGPALRTALAGAGTTVTLCPGEASPPPATQPTQASLQATGDYETFGALFDVEGFFGDAGSATVPAAQSSIQTEALGSVKFESQHYGADFKDCFNHKPSFSFGGSVGLQPALVLENLSSTTTTVSQPNGRPMFQDAFRWTLGPNLNVPLFPHGELSLFADVGENYLISQVTSFKQGDYTITATPVSNNIGQSAIFWETGAQVRIINVPLVQAYSDQTDLLSPAFLIATGYRNDDRFNKASDLAAYTNPEERFFFKFSVGLNKILNFSNTPTQSSPYAFRFGVDYDRPIGTGTIQVPSATRYTVSADLDLVKIFKPTSQ